MLESTASREENILMSSQGIPRLSRRLDVGAQKKAMETTRLGLAAQIARWAERAEDGATAIPALFLFRHEAPTEPVSYMLGPNVCLIAQGGKRVVLGEEVYTYDAHQYLVTSLGLPVIVEIIEASREKPYLGLRLELDQRAMAQLMVDSSLPLPKAQQASRGIAVSKVSLPLLHAFHRLIDLLDEPDSIPVLAPLIQREILYRLLVGEQGLRLRQIATAGTQSHQISRAVDWLKDNFNSLLHVDDLAAYANMSTSAFHHHFRALTAMTPLQFQKWLRLNEARRLMLVEHLDAATAACQVGYESPSQFSREYKRLFGQPPLRDIRDLRQVVVDNSY
jgi:AraC-like DNA-binding protein